MYVEYFIIGLLVINTLIAMISVVFSEVDRIYFPAIACVTVVAFIALGLLVGAPIKKMELDVLQLEGKNYIFHAGVIKEINTTKKKVTVNTVEGVRFGLIYSGQKFYEVE